MPTRKSVRLRCGLFVAATFLTGAVSLRANGTRLPDQDAQATARGDAFVATADDPSAIYYNPAGLTQLSGQQLQAGSYIIRPVVDYTSPSGHQVSAERQTFYLPQIYYSYTPQSFPISFGVGLYSPFGLASDWPVTSGFRTLATHNEITFLTAAPTLAWKVSDQLSLGAGLQINRAKASLNRGIGFVPGDQLNFSGTSTFYGYNLGLLWKPAPSHAFGLAYQSASTAKFSGTSELYPFAPAEPAHANFPFPEVLTAGYSWRPAPGWNLEVDADWTNWSRLGTVVLQKASGPLPLAFDWQSSWHYDLGVTRDFAGGWRVSAGYVYSQNSVPDAHFSPAVPDANRQLLSLGFGRTIGAFSFFAAYQHGFSPDRTVSGSAPSQVGESADGTYKISLDALTFSLRYAF